jgi:hypothetical protein
VFQGNVKGQLLRLIGDYWIYCVNRRVAHLLVWCSGKRRARNYLFYDQPRALEARKEVCRVDG